MVKEKKQISVKKDGWFEGKGELVIDVYQTKDNIMVQAPLAGVSAKDLEIALDGDILTIKGNRESPVEINEKDYLLHECYWGPFSKEIILPQSIEKKGIKATVDNGILSIQLPKTGGEDGKIEVEEV